MAMKKTGGYQPRKNDVLQKGYQPQPFGYQPSGERDTHFVAPQGGTGQASPQATSDGGAPAGNDSGKTKSSTVDEG